LAKLQIQILPIIIRRKAYFKFTSWITSHLNLRKQFNIRCKSKKSFLSTPSQSQNVKYFFVYFQVVVFAVAAMVAAEAEPEAEADASVFYGGYGYAAAPYALGYAGYNGYGAYNGYTGYGYAGYGYSPLAYGYGYGRGYYGAGHFIGKREAEAEAAPEADAHVALAYNYAPYSYAYAPYAYAPYYYAPHASSYQQVSTPFSFQSVHQLHKREAEAEADASVAYAYAPYAYAAYPGVAVHPGLATSFEHRSPQGLGALYRPYGFYGNYYGYY